MKKDFIFTPVLFAIGVALCLLQFTGLIAHIAVSVVGLLVLVAYAVLTRKTWKQPALEIIMRAFYGIALITGVVVMNIHGIAIIGLVHKISAVLFLVLLLVLLVSKLASKQKE